ncbi:MAG: DUF1571 domain-containing protein [Planctomycetes bacterium]|nr:DUF1571 domain-containing protein [Planctomycetota bacterium]
MRRNPFFILPRTIALLVMVSSIVSANSWAQAQQASQLVEPIFRVSNEEDANQTPKLAARIATTAPGSPFDLTQRPGEHPLMPALRMAHSALKNIDADIADYSAILRKQERIDGTLMDEEIAYIKVRNKPFAVYMFFLKPHKGRECLYPNADGKMVAMDCGWKRKFGAVPLDPNGMLAMKGQKYPITKLGIRELTSELITVASQDVKYGECEVNTFQNVMNKRPVTQIVAIHPTKRNNFRYHRAEIFIDNELGLPVRYAAYGWPRVPGGKLPLEEAYTYLNLKINNGFTDADFDPDNPQYFKK